MTEIPEKACEAPEAVLARWSVNRGRTLIAFEESGESSRITCWRLDPSGQVRGSAATWTLADEQPASWNTLGWAGANRLALWRRRDGRNELQIANVEDRESPSVRYKVLGRPIECGLARSEQVEVLVAVSHGDRALLYLHCPDSDSYLPLGGAENVKGVGAWDAAERLLVVNLDAKDDSPGVQLYSYDGSGCTRIDLPWPSEVRPLSAAGYSYGSVGLTGIDHSGQSVPGLLDVSNRSVRWFGAHAGYSCVEPGPLGAHILAAAWSGEEFAYRVLDAAGNRVCDLQAGPGIATDLCFSGDEQHALGWHQSPMAPPDVICWDVRGGQTRPVGRRLGRTAPGEMRWALRWATDADEQAHPEWVFEPCRARNGGTVLFLHGGPRSRLNQTYDPVIAALVGAGWTVVGMNYPGSSGYGAQYREQTRADWGGADARAIEGRVRSLHAAAGNRPICLYGQSYGGYLALLVASTVPELVESVAVWAPVTDLHQLLEAAIGTQRRWLEEEIGDLRFDAQQLWKRSPVSRLSILRDMAVLVGHGRLDDRCPVDQSRRLVRMLGDQSPAAGFVRYLEDAHSTHTPSTWRWWTDAVVAHFGNG